MARHGLVVAVHQVHHVVDDRIPAVAQHSTVTVQLQYSTVQSAEVLEFVYTRDNLRVGAVTVTVTVQLQYSQRECWGLCTPETCVQVQLQCSTVQYTYGRRRTPVGLHPDYIQKMN